MDIDFAERRSLVAQTLREFVIGDDGKESYRGALGAVPYGKTDESSRVVDLPQVAIDALRERQRIAKGEARSRRSPYCFTASNGSPLRASNFNRRTWRDIRDAAGLPEVTMHGLRHACSSIMASRGASAKQIAARLGHADVRLTLNRYTQLDRTSQVAGAAIFDQEFGRAS